MGCRWLKHHVNASHFLIYYICKMNRQQKRSLTRKAIKEMKKAKPTKVKKIDDAFDKKIEAIKNKRNETVKKLPIYKKILGIAFLPLMFLLFSVDRFIHLFLPHATHASFKLYLIEPSSLKLTFIRIAMVAGIIILFNLIF
tara:strand:- start:1633 stop:2055 length:423 start_codon:yes stop_codon:yes gene_type:complete